MSGMWKRRQDQANVLATLKVEKEPLWVAVDPAGRYAFVVNHHSDTVSVINLDHLRVDRTVPVGERPSLAAVSPPLDPDKPADQGAR